MVSTIRESISPVLINTKYDYVRLLNWVIGIIPREKETVNKHDYCYQFSIDVPELLFGNLGNRDRQ